MRRRPPKPSRPALAGCRRCRFGGTVDVRWTQRMRIGGTVSEVTTTVAAACPLCEKGRALVRSIGSVDVVLARLQRNPATVRFELVGDALPSLAPTPRAGSSWAARSVLDEEDARAPMRGRS